VASFGSQGLPAGQRVLYDLRAIGIQANTDIRASSLKSHLKQADRLGASLTVIVGDDEAAKDRVVVRDMTTKEQVELPLSSVANSLRTRLNTA
jgi:histidyl-tRNA synthetase